MAAAVPAYFFAKGDMEIERKRCFVRQCGQPVFIIASGYRISKVVSRGVAGIARHLRIVLQKHFIKWVVQGSVLKIEFSDLKTNYRILALTFVKFV